MSEQKHRMIQIGLVLIITVYVLQTMSPLRLVNDGIDYLLQASSAADGSGFLVHGKVSMRPPGYPFLIFILIKTGLGKPWAIVALNCLFLIAGCMATYLISRQTFGLDPLPSSLICMMSLLSFVLVRQSTQPLSDICYFGASAFCVFLLQREEHESKSRWWVLACLCSLLAACIQLRTIGIALIPAFLWVAVRGTTGIFAVWQWTKRNRIMSILVPVTTGMALVATAILIRHSPYFAFNKPIFEHRGLVGAVVSNVLDHSQEWGELTVNIPASKLPGPSAALLRGIGAMAIAVCAIGFWQRCSCLTAVELYLLGFALIVFVYPWFDTRLWLPVIPFLMIYFLLGAKQIASPAVFRLLLWGHGLGFALLGILALGYSTRLTFAGARFADLYGDGRLRPAYQIALGKPAGPGAVDADALYLLKRYH